MGSTDDLGPTGTLFEAVAIAGRLMARVGVLHREGDRIDLTEVESTSINSDEHPGVLERPEMEKYRSLAPDGSLQSPYASLPELTLPNATVMDAVRDSDHLGSLGGVSIRVRPSLCRGVWPVDHGDLGMVVDRSSIDGPCCSNCSLPRKVL